MITFKPLAKLPIDNHCHSERSEESHIFRVRRSFTPFRMTEKRFLQEAYFLILMIQPNQRHGLLYFSGPFYQEKCQSAGLTCHCHGKPPRSGCAGFPPGGILFRNGSQGRQLEEFQSKTWYNGALLAVLTSDRGIRVLRVG